MKDVIPGLKALVTALVLALPLGFLASRPPALPPPVDPLDEMIRASWEDGPKGAGMLLGQDETQRQCSAHPARLPDDVAVAIMEREWSSIRYPADGVLFGDWRRGAALAIGIGERATGDPAPNHCAGCHRLEPGGTSGLDRGSSLIGYGVGRIDREGLARSVYDRIYTSQASVPCSAMPRFGATGILSPGDIADIVAYLLDADSPVNRAAEAALPPRGPTR